MISFGLSLKVNMIIVLLPLLDAAYCKPCWQQEVGVARSRFQCHQWWITCRKQTCNAGTFLDIFSCYIVTVLVDYEFLINLHLQEFMILPVGASSFKEAMKMGVEVYHNLKVGYICLFGPLLGTLSILSVLSRACHGRMTVHSHKDFSCRIHNICLVSVHA